MKTVFITGTSSGLGKAAVKLFHDKGWYVIATMRNIEKAGDFDGWARVTVLSLDISDLAQIEAAIRQAIQSGGVDVVINNAAFANIGPLESVTDEQLQQQINTNLLGAIRVTKAFIPHFRKRKSGTFINITSIAGFVTFPFSSLYHTSKFGMEAFSEGVSYELAPFGIKVKTVAPGFIWSAFGGNTVITTAEPYQDALGHFEEVAGTMMDPSKVGTSPEEMAALVYDALMDESDRLHYIAGADARQTYDRRQEIGAEALRIEMAAVFLG
jgi:NAD(P)-dependent dehydrogenase (short-subunit alcohol dehydrogenase family)